VDLEPIFLKAEHANASDILLSPGCAPTLRVAGRLRPLDAAAPLAEDIIALIRELAGPKLTAGFESSRELDFAVTHLGHRLRANAYWRTGEPALALRLVPHAPGEPEALGLPKSLIELVDQPQGLMLFTGAAGQGKTTSQASLIAYLNHHRYLHVVTIEDPVEFIHRSHLCIIDQREVGIDTASFASAMRHVIRQNPDVILLGEMRDFDTMKAALDAAESGHLVMSTMHANDACQAIDRIVSSFPEVAQAQIRTQLSLVLIAVVHQRLVHSKAGKLVLVAEVLTNNPAISRLVRDGKTAQLYGAIELDTGQYGFRTINQGLEALVAQGVISREEAHRHINRRESHLQATEARRSVPR